MKAKSSGRNHFDGHKWRRTIRVGDGCVVAVSCSRSQNTFGKTVLRPIVYGSKLLTRAQLNNGAPKLELCAEFFFIENFHSYLKGWEFKLRVDSQALSWLKTYSLDHVMINRWIARLDQIFKPIHRPWTQHRNVDGLSKRTNDYLHRERIIEKLSELSERFNFMFQKDYEELLLVPYFDSMVD